jgi:catechol 2,3-dioxygenase-like lactoylglutathione lyase family enzyme
MLAAASPVAFVATTDSERALRFYRDVLGLRLIADDPFALVFDLAGVPLRIQKVQQHTPLPFTSLGWQVDSIDRVVSVLSGKGVRFERYDGIDQTPAGIWRSPSGAQVAWFKDPDGNLLSLTQGRA